MMGIRLFVCAWMIAIACGACASPIEQDRDSPVEQDLYLLELDRERVGDTWREYGYGGCTLVSVGGSGTASSGDLVVETNVVGAPPVVHVNVRSAGEILKERDYDLEFLASGKVDRIDVVTAAGRVHQLNFWGGPECDYSKVPDSES